MPPLSRQTSIYGKNGKVKACGQSESIALHFAQANIRTPLENIVFTPPIFTGRQAGVAAEHASEIAWAFKPDRKADLRDRVVRRLQQQRGGAYTKLRQVVDRRHAQRRPDASATGRSRAKSRPVQSHTSRSDTRARPAPSVPGHFHPVEAQKAVSRFPPFGLSVLCYYTSVSCLRQGPIRCKV